VQRSTGVGGMKHIIATLALLCGTAHASGDHDLWFEAKDRYNEVRMGWIVSDDVTQTCNMLIALKHPSSKYDPNIKACAVRKTTGGFRMCDIYTSKQTSLAIIGHEARHCFEGAWHP
jgi:hypothetical protein